MCQELSQLNSSAAQPNILRDITSSSNMQRSKIYNQTPHDATHVLSRDISMDASLSHNNYCKKQSVEIDTSLTLQPTA